MEVENYHDGMCSKAKTTEVFLALESESPISEVIPRSYEEGVAYLQGKRLMVKL